VRGVLVLALVAACGRIGFDVGVGDATTGDAIGDATGTDVQLAGHDEDGDGLDDNIDPCPHIAGDMDDDDDDGVGNACDPGDGLHRIVLFDAMTRALSDPSITVQGPWQQGDDDLALDVTSFSAINRTVAITSADIWIGLSVETLAVSADQQIIIHASTGTEQPRYFGQMYRTQTLNEQGIVSYDDVSFTDVDSVPLGAGGIPTADITLRLHMRIGDDASWTTSWPGEGYQSRGPTPGYTGSPRVRFAMTGMTGAVRYTFITANQ
jgi:hypothetical protein